MRLCPTLALLCLAPAAFASRPLTPEELPQTRRIDGAQVSPDGRAILFTSPRAEGGAARDASFGDSDWPAWRLGGGDDVAVTQHPPPPSIRLPRNRLEPR